MARDIRCLDDMTLFADECESELEELEQDVYHVLIQELGSNLDDPNRGLGLDDLLSSDDSVLNGIASRAEIEVASRDDRIASTSAQLVRDENDDPRLELQIVPSDPTLENITLIVTNGGLVK